MRMHKQKTGEDSRMCIFFSSNVFSVLRSLSICLLFWHYWREAIGFGLMQLVMSIKKQKFSSSGVWATRSSGKQESKREANVAKGLHAFSCHF